MDEISHFQIQVARHWIAAGERANGVPEFEFVAYFAALNALYWLWGLTNQQEAFTDADRRSVETVLSSSPELGADLRQRVLERLRGLRGEHALIEGVVESIGEPEATPLLESQNDCVRYLVDRGPVYRMDGRTRTKTAGSPRDGRRHLATLVDPSASAAKKAAAMAGILYLIRCNLVHGSKSMSVDDGTLMRRTVPALRAIAQAVLANAERSTLR